jgi:hypothetical protein
LSKKENPAEKQTVKTAEKPAGADTAELTLPQLLSSFGHRLNKLEESSSADPHLEKRVARLENLLKGIITLIEQSVRESIKTPEPLVQEPQKIEKPKEVPGTEKKSTEKPPTKPLAVEKIGRPALPAAPPAGEAVKNIPTVDYEEAVGFVKELIMWSKNKNPASNSLKYVYDSDKPGQVTIISNLERNEIFIPDKNKFLEILKTDPELKYYPETNSFWM